MRKLKPREVKWLAQCHKSAKQQRWGENISLLVMRFPIYHVHLHKANSALLWRDAWIFGSLNSCLCLYWSYYINSIPKVCSEDEFYYIFIKVTSPCLKVKNTTSLLYLVLYRIRWFYSVLWKLYGTRIGVRLIEFTNLSNEYDKLRLCSTLGSKNARGNIYELELYVYVRLFILGGDRNSSCGLCTKGNSL